MENLEQFRAAHALNAARQLDRGAVTKLPALIINNGFLATLAFALDSPSREAMLDALLKITDYLREHGLLNRAEEAGNKVEQATVLMRELSGGSSLHLQRVTTEALKYLSYLKRFTPKET